MKLFTKVFIAFFFLAFLIFSRYTHVLGQATDTPTPSPSSVSTPTLPFYGDCPQGDLETVSGWGTYTPSPLWDLECSPCFSTPTLTETPYPTGTTAPTIDPTIYPTEFSGTATSEFLTGTPTVQITETPAGAGLSCVYGGSIDCSQIDHDTIRLHGNVYDDAIIPNHAAWLQSQVLSDPSVTAHVIINSAGVTTPYSDSIKFDTESQGYGGSDVFTLTVGSYVFDIPHSDYLENLYYNHVVSGTYEFDTALSSDGLTTVTLYSLYQDGGRHVLYVWGENSYIQISVASSLTPTPTITPTFAPSEYSNYCSSIAPIEEDTFGFDLFIPDGVPNCDLGWDSFEVGTYEIPGVEICFQPSQFGVITLFDNEFEVGIFGLVAAAAALWRYFRTNS